MATISLQQARTVTPGKVLYYPEAASQSFKAGEFVYLVAGKVTVCPTDPVGIAGMALQDASGTPNTAIAIMVAEPGILFEANVNSGVTAITQVGFKYGLVRDATNKWSHIDVSDQSNIRFIVVDLSPKDEAGDTYGRVYVEVLEAYCQLSASTS